MAGKPGRPWLGPCAWKQAKRGGGVQLGRAGPAGVTRPRWGAARWLGQGRRWASVGGQKRRGTSGHLRLVGLVRRERIFLFLLRGFFFKPNY